MRLTAPRVTVRVGDVEIRGVQRVLETDAREPTSFDPAWLSNYHHKENDTQGVPPSAIHAIQSRTAIVVPCKDECVDRIRGVWGAIPASSLIILISGSASDAYTTECDALEAFCRQTGRNGIAVHQRDPKLAAALRAVGMKALLDDDDDGLIHKGKGEALAIGIALAATARGPPGSEEEGDDLGIYTTRGPCCRGQEGEMRGEMRCGNGYARETMHGNVQQRACSKQHNGSNGTCHSHQGTKSHTTSFPGGYYKYIGFVDADNFVPGSVQEYCKAFSAGLHLARGAEDAMVRIRWPSKPKIHDGELDFKSSGRSSEIVNRWLNSLLKNMDSVDIDTGDDSKTEDEDDFICTGNAGEHAMTMSLALKLRLASGYAIEPFHFLDIWERFAFGERDVGVDATGITAASQGERTMQDADFATRRSTSPIFISPLGSSSAATPADCSPLLSASEDSTFPTSPSVFSDGQALSSNVPACQLPPPITTTGLNYKRTAPNDVDTPPSSLTSAPAKIVILQIRTLSPHFHESRGDEHVVRMWKQGLSAIYHSPITTLTACSALKQYRDDLRSTIFSSGCEGSLPTPPLSRRLSVTSTLADGAESGDTAVAGAFVNDEAVLAAAGWQPERCRIYPPAYSMDLKEFRAQLEGDSGSFWWTGKDEIEIEAGPSIGFDEVAVLGLGPVSREKRPEGDVAGFKAFVDGTMDEAEAPGPFQLRPCPNF